MWNETDSSAAREQIAQAWTADGRYVDPMLEAEGHAALADDGGGQSRLKLPRPSLPPDAPVSTRITTSFASPGIS